MKIVIHWFRRDLRLEDNTALNAALSSDLPVLPIFIFDNHILDSLKPEDARVKFIHQHLEKINQELKIHQARVVIKKGTPLEAWSQIISAYEIDTVYTNHDYEPYGIDRDEAISKLLASHDIKFETFKDQVVFEKKEVQKDDGTPYTVFTPYYKKWIKKWREDTPQIKPCPNTNFLKTSADFPKLEDLGFVDSLSNFPLLEINPAIIKQYEAKRDTPFGQNTSHLGVHLRFGTLSIRKLALIAETLSEVYLKELVWRDFYQQILYHFPQTPTHEFHEKYNNIPWRNNKIEFEKWCQGRTGYPLVDAGMRELNTTGFMHNRVRMLAASFLTKHLLIDWRWGEQYFAEKLLDFDLASNVGGWQWAAGCGTDAAPYFRIFSPEAQQKKFDPEFEYIKQWVPEYGSLDYPTPIVDHKSARARCLSTFKLALVKHD